MGKAFANPRLRPSARFFAKSAKRLAGDESGVALVFTIAVFLFLFVLILSIYSIGENIRMKEELQNACDAAAQSAAAVEADALSRIAVLNRALSWHYIQMTKEQMDYIAWKFLIGLRDNFKEDMKAVRQDSKFRWNKNAAYYHLEKHSLVKAVNGILEWAPLNWYRTGSSWNRKYWCSYLRLKCHNPYGSGVGSHADPSNPKVRFIGFGIQNEANRYKIRLGYDDDSYIFYDPSDDDLHFEKGDGKGILAQLSEAFGEGGIDSLKASIDNHKTAITSINAIYEMIGAAYYESVNETIRRTLFANLPHDSNGEVPEELLSEYRWAARFPAFTAPAEYPSLSSTEENEKSQPSVQNEPFFTGLRNTEEDELLFLNMVDGLPSKRSTPVVLSDYFSDTTLRELSSEGGLPIAVAAGLDQWFIRTTADDVCNSNDVSIVRGFPFAYGGGIMRGYKNANYFEGSQGAWFGKDVHRGNHIFNIPQGLLNDEAVGVGSLTSALSAFDFSFGGFADNAMSYIMQIVTQILGEALQATLGSIVDELLGGVDKLLDVDPSCRNDRAYFPDMCANVNSSFGLVAEYEWAAAEYFCLYMTGRQKNRWFPIQRLKSSTERKTPELCAHIVIPAGAIFGAPDVSPSHSYGDGLFGFIKEQVKAMAGPGHSRAEYKTTFVNLSNEKFSLPHDPNTILKGYCRFYGDDQRIVDNAYYGVPAQPWLLNERYFAGEGTIIVALARKRTNVFARMLGEDEASQGLTSVFSAIDNPKDGDEANGRSGVASSIFVTEKKDRYMMAVSAARAAPAQRGGDQGAIGKDTVNEPQSFGGTAGYAYPPRHEIAFDAATWRNLGAENHPELPDGDYDNPDKHTLETEYRIGCPCGAEATERRLDMQWNLSQTDWEPRLIPVRYAFAQPEAVDSGAKPKIVTSEWAAAAEPPSDGAIRNAEGVIKILGMLPWYRFDSEEKIFSGEVMPTTDGDSLDAWIEMTRKRMIH